ncbi:MAG: hypothetical protein WD737_06855 [Gemmatimonadota bacterium]
MFDDIRRIFHRSMQAFREEVGRKEPEDEVADLLAAMRRELVAARAAIPEFEADVSRSGAALQRERELLAACERRRALADKIEDVETVRVAVEFATGHRERIAVLEQRLSAAEAELALRRREADEMRIRYKEAEANRFALLAQLRRVRAGERIRSDLSDEEGPQDDFGRMEERIAREAAYADAVEELGEDERPPPASAQRSESELDERLEELKRRMGRQ